MRLWAPLSFASLLLAATPSASQSIHAAHDGSTVVCVRGDADPDSLGCHILAERELRGQGLGPIFWHVDRFSTSAAAAAAAETNSVVLRAFGAFWLMTIAPKAWLPNGGERVAN